MNRRKFIYTSAGIGSIASLSVGAVAPDSLNDKKQVTERKPEKEVLKLLNPQSKVFLAKAKRHQNECYYPVVSDIDEGKNMAFIRVKGEKEELVFQQMASPNSERVLASDTYIFDPEFCGSDLFWVQQEGKDWKIKWVDPRQTEAKPKSPFSHWGRPLSLQSYFADNRKYLIWEERKGKQTKVFLGIIENNKVQNTQQVPWKEGNLYDPVCVLGTDGLLYIAFGAFVKGNYHIYLQRCDARGKIKDKAFRITHGEDACLYPSLTPHPQKGVWLSYTKYNLPFEFRDWDMPYVEHPRRNAQHNFFQSHGMVHAGYFDGEKLWAAYAPPKPGQLDGGMAAMMVFGTDGAGRSKIITDSKGRASLLFRAYQKEGAISYRKEEDIKKFNPSKGPAAAHNVHPDLCLVTLLDDCWSDPLTLVTQAHFDGKISTNQSGQNLRIAFSEDGRQVGWGPGGEWFDDQHEVGIGILSTELAESSAPNYDFRHYLIKPLVTGCLEEPAFGHKDDTYIFAKGQTHKHTNHSVCTREFDMDHHMNYRFLQDVMHCDFGAITDHSYNFWQTEILYLNKIATYYYFPGEFVALPAYEWTSKEGHINPLYLEEEGGLKVYQPHDENSAGNTFNSLCEQYRGMQVITPPHHMADALLSYHWEHFDEKLMPVVEVFQDNRGSCEQPDVPGVTNYLHTQEDRWVIDQLNGGKKIGLMASADHVGVAQAIVPVKALTRTALYQAFQRRSCFGSTGLSLHLHFGCNGKMMGEEVNAAQANFNIKIKAPEKIAEIHLLRDGKPYKIIETDKHEHQESWEVHRISSGEYWFCRVLFENGEMAWSSPIWLT